MKKNKYCKKKNKKKKRKGKVIINLAYVTFLLVFKTPDPLTTTIR